MPISSGSDFKSLNPLACCTDLNPDLWLPLFQPPSPIPLLSGPCSLSCKLIKSGLAGHEASHADELSSPRFICSFPSDCYGHTNWPRSTSLIFQALPPPTSFNDSPPHTGPSFARFYDFPEHISKCKNTTLSTKPWFRAPRQ